MKAGKTLQDLAAELDRQAKTKQDLLVDLEALHMDDELKLRVGGSRTFGVNNIAHRQLGEYFKIPARYYDRMVAEAPDLLATNVNRWLTEAPGTRRMLRTLDGTARAFLSDRYRRIDNYEVAQTVLPIIGNMDGTHVESCELTESRMYIKVVNTRVTAEIAKGDIVQAGIIITNSEVGLGSVSIKPLIFRLVCLNGMIVEDGAVRKYHIGRLNESEGSFNIYRDETIEADDKAFLMKIEDAVTAAVDEARFKSTVERLRQSKDAKIDPPTVPKVVELTAKTYNITQEESEGVLGHLIAGGDLSLYSLGNAVTRHAHDVDSYDRSTELEAIGYKIATMSGVMWRQLTRTGGI